MDVSAAGFTGMQVTAAGETGEYFLHGIFKHMPFSIQLSDPADYHGADFAFVAHTMNRASAYRQDAELFLQNILKKLNLSSRVQIAVYAVENGLSGNGP